MKRLFDSAIAECIWRQPSILLIEDLETLCKAPTGPEEEASPEIIYSSKISEGQYNIHIVCNLYTCNNDVTSHVFP